MSTDTASLVARLRTGDKRRCPFDKPNDLLPTEPCPVCGDLGELPPAGEPMPMSKCVSTGVHALHDAAADLIERLSAPHPTERVPEVEIDDDGTVVLSWPGALEISILPSGKVVGTHSPATRGIAPWTAYDPPAAIEQSSKVGSEIRWLLAEFVRFAGDAPRLDFDEDVVLSWISYMTDRATKALAAPVKESLTTGADRQAIRAETFWEAAGVARAHERKRAEMAADLRRHDATRHMNAVVANECQAIATAIESLAGEPDAAFPVQTGETI